MTGRDVLVIMAAGGGKSLCYQLPAMLRGGTTLVVSPLLSLIQDQVMGLAALGISAYMLTSTSGKENEKFVYKALEKGEDDLKILYVTPEKVSKSKRFMSKLEKCHNAGRLSLISIDEAHCCSQWGHDFRPDYKNLSILKTQFPKVPMVALTVCFCFHLWDTL
jgi:ATP-dependent DNA helicase Q1